MDGLALSRHILSKVPNTPVLVMTAYAAQDVKGRSELRVRVGTSRLGWISSTRKFRLGLAPAVSVADQSVALTRRADFKS